MSRPRLFRLLRCASSGPLHPSRRRPTQRLFQTTTADQDEMFLQQYPQSHHVQFRKKPRPTLLQMSQARMRFLPVGQRRPQGQHKTLVGRGKVHDTVQRSSGETQTPRCLVGNPLAERRARKHRQAHEPTTRQMEKNTPRKRGNGSLRGQLASGRDQTITTHWSNWLHEKTGGQQSTPIHWALQKTGRHPRPGS